MNKLSFLFFIITMLPAMASDPGPAALAFLEKLRSGAVDYGPEGDTALRANTSNDKLARIRRHLDRLGKDLAGGRLELGEVKQDGNYAGALIRKIGTYDSSDVNVIPVALVREGGEWLPAPVIASFENAVPGYTTELKRRLEALEMWMLRQRVRDLELIISESGERMRREILQNFPPEMLVTQSPTDFVNGFLDACDKRNQGAILGYLGGLEEKKPADWAERLEISRKLNDPDLVSGWPWRLAVSEEVVREVVFESSDDRGGSVSIACLDPALVARHGSLSKIKLLHFDVRRGVSGKFLINLPDALILNDMEELHTDENLDVDLLDRFTESLRENDGVNGGGTAAGISEDLLRVMKSGTLREVLALVDFEGTPKEARIAATSAAEMWWSLNDPATFRIPVKVGFKDEGGMAMAAYQWFSMTRPERFEPITFTFKKTTAGWLWVPGIVSKDEREDQNSLNKWARTSADKWQAEWLEELLKESERLEEIHSINPVTDREAMELVESWYSLVRDGDFVGALGLSAWCRTKDGIPLDTLRNISYAVTDARRTESEITDVFRNDSWVAVAVKHVGEHGVFYSLAPVITTGRGGRLLPEIDLIIGKDRTRRFLNEQVFRRLGDDCDPNQVRDLKRIFEEFSERMEGM